MNNKKKKADWQNNSSSDSYFRIRDHAGSLFLDAFIIL